MPKAKKTAKRKYSSKASHEVEKTMHEYKKGDLKMGKSGKTVSNRKQAIAIGLSETKKKGGKGSSKKS